MKTETLIVTIIARILFFPFMAGIALTWSVIMFVRWMINYVRFGGETFVYTNKMNRISVTDVYGKVEQIINTKESVYNTDELRHIAVNYAISCIKGSTAGFELWFNGLSPKWREIANQKQTES